MLFNVGLVINVIFHVTLRSFMVFNGECWVHEVLKHRGWEIPEAKVWESHHLRGPWIANTAKLVHFPSI